MLEGFVGGLIIAWLLTWFRVDHIIITAIQETFKITISISQYYIVFALIGLIGGFFKR